MARNVVAVVQTTDDRSNTVHVSLLYTFNTIDEGPKTPKLQRKFNTIQVVCMQGDQATIYCNLWLQKATINPEPVMISTWGKNHGGKKTIHRESNFTQSTVTATSQSHST